MSQDVHIGALASEESRFPRRSGWRVHPRLIPATGVPAADNGVAVSRRVRLPVLIVAAIVVAVGLWLLFRFVFDPLDPQPGAASWSSVGPTDQ